MRNSIILFLIFCFQNAVTSQINVKPDQLYGKAKLKIEKFDINIISGKFTNGQNGMIFHSEMPARNNKLITTITDIKGTELVYIETSILPDTSGRIIALRYFNKEIQYNNSKQTLIRISGRSFGSKKDFEKYMKEKLSRFPEIRMIPQLSVALGLLNINGKFFPAAQQIYKLGSLFAKFKNERDIQMNANNSVLMKYARNRNEPYGKITLHTLASNSPNNLKKTSTGFADILVYSSPGVDPINIDVARTVSLQIKLERMQKDPCYCDATCPPGMAESLCQSRANYCVELDRQCSGVIDTNCEEYPNQNDGCFGMCGNECSCWRWYCGDCCYHDICARHDRACREDNHLDCALLPFGNQCSPHPIISVIRIVIDLF